MLGIGLSLTSRLRGSAFSPVSLFRSNEPGIVIDPSDLSTLFQDTAGTTPVAAPGQTVALALDKSRGLVLGPELWANQTPTIDNASGSVGAYNTSTRTMTNTGSVVAGYPRFQFNLGLVPGRTYLVSGTLSGSINQISPIRLANSGLANSVPYSTTTGVFFGRVVAAASFIEFGTQLDGAEAVTIDNISVRELPGNHLTQPVAAARPIYGRHPARGYVNQLVNSDTVVTQNVTVQGVAMTLSFTGTGTVTLSGASTAGPLVGTGTNDRVSLAFTPSAGTLTLTVSGDVRFGQLERGTLTAYQRTGAGNGLAFPRPVSYDITEAGVPNVHYLFFDGLARWMVSPTITPGVDKAQIFAGVRKLSDAAIGVAVELSTSTSANNGAFYLATPVSTSVVGRNEFSSKGTTAQVANAINAAPTTNVLTGLGDIAADNATLRVNATQAAQNTADQGTGNFLAYPLYIGSRAGTSLFLNALIYSLVVRFGPNLPLATIQQVERWTAQRTGVTLP